VPYIVNIMYICISGRKSLFILFLCLLLFAFNTCENPIMVRLLDSLVPQNEEENDDNQTNEEGSDDNHDGGSTSYTVTFNVDGGTPVPSSPVTVEYGSTIDLPTAMTKTGYTFDNWYMDSAKTIPVVFPITVTGNVSLYAKWNPISYTVVYNKNASGATGTTETSSHTYDEPKLLTANGYSYSGYTFAGWARTEGGTVEFTNGHSVVNLTSENNATVTLYARWGTQPYYIEYNKNSDDAEENMMISTFFFGIEQNLKENSFTRTGYTFAGWAKTSGGSVEFSDKEAVLDLAGSAGATIKLYAKWTAHTLDINYAGGGGDGSAPSSPISAAYGTSITIPANTYIRKGYAFAGWEVSGTGSLTGTYAAEVNVAVSALSTAIANGNASITLTVKWTIDMVYVPGGSFEMGSNSGYDNQQPVHTVTLSGFYMGKYEVTQEQWTAVMGNNPSFFPSSPATGEIQNKRPVEYVSWYNALVFCNKLSMMEGLSPAYRISGSTDPANWGNVPTSINSTWNAVEIVAGSTGYRLPTEAQWEYAARGGNGSPGNYTYSGSDIVDDVAWYTSNSGNETHEVGKKAANGLGLYDMSGNVSEWCWDWFGSYPSEAQTNPVGAVIGSYRVSRGNECISNAQSLRPAYRNYNYPNYQGGNFFGFRLARP